MCKYFDVYRSQYYRQLKSNMQEKLEESLIVKLVQARRKQLPREGGKKLFHKLYPDIQAVGKVGRDKFFEILRNNNMLVERKRSYTRTTDSYHRFYCWSNLVKDTKLTRSNQCWVCDITYIRVGSKFCYLSLVTDLFSRKIVGWHLSHSLSIEGCIEALQMALKQRKDKSLSLIHHSDRGVQYCCKEYVNILQAEKVSISMTEENHCYENATAERVNGILKDEFLLSDTFKSKKDAYVSVRQAIFAYNEIRLHWSLNLKTPSEVHMESA